ncbi:hypothetical protein Hte_005289 [Hypoxylon texense]
MSAEVKPPAYHSVEGVDVPRSMDVASPERALVNSFALLLSTSRNSTRTSALEVTATALQRSDPTTGDGACKYTLYIAKNGNFSPRDAELMESMKDWINWKSGNESLGPDNKCWSLVTTHISNRIQSYLSFTKNDIFDECYRHFRRCRRRLQRAHSEDQGENTSILSCLSELRGLLGIIKSKKDASALVSQDDILVRCFEFTQNHADVIRDLMACLQGSGQRGRHILFVITSINKLARVPLAFKDLFKFRKSCITKDKDYFDVVQVPRCAPECHPDVSNVKLYIEELKENSTYSHIEEELGKIVENIKSQRTTVHCEIQVLNYILQRATENELNLREIAWGLPKALLDNEKIVNALSSLSYKMDEILQDEILNPRRRGSTNIENSSPSPKDTCIDEWVWNPAFAPESPVLADFQANYREAPDAGKLEEIDQLLVRLMLMTPK